MIFLKTAEYSTERAYSEEKSSIYLSFSQLAVKILWDVDYDMSNNYSSVVFHASLSLVDSIQSNWFLLQIWIINLKIHIYIYIVIATKVFDLSIVSFVCCSDIKDAVNWLIWDEISSQAIISCNTIAQLMFSLSTSDNEDFFILTQYTLRCIARLLMLISEKLVLL